jgi:hypothetical protein
MKPQRQPTRLNRPCKLMRGHNAPVHLNQEILNMTHLTEAQIIAQQNDVFRKNFGSPIDPNHPIQGEYNATQGFISLDPGDQLVTTLKIRNYNDFIKPSDLPLIRLIAI